MPQVDFSKVSSDAQDGPIPAGTYTCCVGAIEERQTRNGDDLWKIVWVVRDGAFAGRRLTDYVAFSQKALPRVKLLCEAVGISTSGATDLQPAMFEGKTCRLTVRIETYEDARGNERERSAVTFGGYAPPDEAPRPGANESADDDIPF